MAKRIVDTGTWLYEVDWPDDEYFDSITPEGVQWAARQLHGHVKRYIDAVFAWILKDIPNVEPGRATVAFMVAEGAMSNGRSLHDVLDDLLLAAEKDMPCAREKDPRCDCGFCSFGRDEAAADAAYMAAVADDEGWGGVPGEYLAAPVPAEVAR
jgi:hypothetical protein